MASISLRGLTKRYPTRSGGVDALRGVTLDIAAGEFVAITGPSGSGKSTLMHILGCLERPSTGVYALGDEDVAGFTTPQLARLRNERIGFIFQDVNLLPRATVLENAELPLLYARPLPNGASRRALALRALEKVDLAERANDQGADLSGGQQQRLAIARALVNAPSLILADEPTGHLDSAASANVLSLLKDLHERLGATIILVTHDSQVAARAERTITMKDGMIQDDRPNSAADPDT